MSKSNNLQDFLTDVADAIRAKKGSSDLIDPQDFSTEIANLPTGGGKFASLVDRSITEVTANDLAGATKIGDSAFKGCKSLINVVIPNGITKIESNAFNGCSILTTVSISDSVTTLEQSCFGMCTTLQTVVIGTGLTSIGAFVFNMCYSLLSVTINAVNPPSLPDTSAFNNTNSCPIYVPADSVSAYKSASGWSSLSSRIQAIPS